MLDWATAQRIGFSRIVSLGESADVELGDILDYLALDLPTRAILVHIEGIADARRFMSAARAAARVKPVIVLKAGRQIGPLPAQGQSRRLRLNRDRVYDAAFVRAGIVRVDTIEELFAAAASLGANAARRGSGLRNGRLALLTNGHAPGRAGRRHGRRRRRRASSARRRGSTARSRGRWGRPPRSRARSTSAPTPAATPMPPPSMSCSTRRTSTACWSSTRRRPGSTPAR